MGATLGDLRAYVGIRDLTHVPLKDDRAILRRLEEDGTLVQVGDKWFLTPEGRKEAKGPALEPQWCYEDSWVLLALLYNNRESRLRDIVATADFIEHAILTRPEMHGALNRLLAGGLIARKADRFAVTEKAAAMFAKVEASCKGFVRDQLDGLTRILRCPCCGVRLKEVRWRIDLDAAFEAAVDAYLGRGKGPVGGD